MARYYTYCASRDEDNYHFEGLLVLYMYREKQMKITNVRSQAVRHVGPLHKTPGHPAREPWEILLASIVLRLT